MPKRYNILANNEVYHVYNRSVGNEEIFSSIRHINRVLNLINYYRFPQIVRYSRYITLPKSIKDKKPTVKSAKKPLVQIYAFALMPNHYHFLLKQVQDDGIRTFISNFQNSYAKYFNIVRKRHGSLFDNAFKAKRIEKDAELMHVARYIHLNPVTSFMIDVKGLPSYTWTSFPAYMNKKEIEFISKDVLKGYFKTEKKHYEFLADQADYQKKLQLIKRYLLD